MNYKQTILLTGGLGFIGSHACVELVEAGYHVVIVDNLSNSQAQVLESIRRITGVECVFYRYDIRDQQAMTQLFKQHNIDAVMHFAGLKAVGESVQHPLHYYQNNVYGSMVLLQCMQEASVKHIIFSSSATVYGEPSALPITETEGLKPTNPYGQSKLMVENILADVCASDPEFNAVILRYFNPVGAHASALIGENPNDIPNNLVPYIAKVASGELDHLNIFGNDYPTPDGTGVRDYIHISDLVSGHIKALQALLSKQLTHWQVFNLGTGKGASVLEVKQGFEQAAKCSIAVRYTPRRAGDIASCYASVDKARRELNWSAQYSLIEMLNDAWRFKKRQLDEK